MLSTITIAQMTADINGILDGTITSVAGLSDGCDKTNSTMTGTYPTGTYTKVNGTTNTFSKVHNADNTFTHYFRLTYDSVKMTTFSLAQSYTSGTDTLVNGVANTVNVLMTPYVAADQFAKGVNIVITSKCVAFLSVGSGISFGIFDLGNNGITAAYANNMKTAYIKFNDSTFNIPYAYSLAGSTSGYASLSGSLTNLQSPVLKTNSASKGVIAENPVFLSQVNQGYQAYGIYNLFKLGNNVLSADTVYNTSGTSRIVAYDYAIVTE